MTKPGSFRVSRLFRSGRLSFYGLAWAIRLFQSSNPRRNRRRVNDSGPESVSVSVDPVAAEELANLEYAEPVVNDPYALKYGLRFNPKWVLKPWSKWNYRWLAVISLAVIYNLLLIFPRAVYEQLEDDCGFRTTFTVLDYTCDFIYVCDMVASFLSGFLENGIVLREPRRLWHKYRTSSKTKLDILSLLPTDICFIFTGYRVPYPIVRINRLFRMHRLSEFIYRAETRSSSPILIRIGVLIAILAILTHINGCLYYFISAQIGIGSDVWVYPATARWRTNTTDHQQDTLWQKWSFCTYWSAMMLTSILPNMNNPTTTAEHIFHCAVILVGMLVFATIVARISRMILDINKKRDIFRSKEEGVKGYLQVHKVGADMDSRVTRWFNYIWSTKQDLDEESVLTLLPEKLRMEIARFVHISVLKQVKLFHELDEQFLEELVLKLRFQVHGCLLRDYYTCNSCKLTIRPRHLY
ncbi:hypothetical protein RvY_05128-2 [Ramazzottius varieornatus]|uniref:Ion transport domain-containing protein n=1 Tax=Ramazzottius varieornatus TaxID=947166 RepID=A0A1D1UU01_RAMVA|nr:hypothetical protein RvY_05128-2 [Ramazzottius varieornatus]